jgi:hypothetical protein
MTLSHLVKMYDKNKKIKKIKKKLKNCCHQVVKKLLKSCQKKLAKTCHKVCKNSDTGRRRRKRRRRRRICVAPRPGTTLSQLVKIPIDVQVEAKVRTNVRGVIYPQCLGKQK